MIPKKDIQKWGTKVAWAGQEMVEQDLIISKALVCLYSDPVIQEKLVFRGGTALNKLHLNPPTRYSEDIDFVQRSREPAGPIINTIRAHLDSWLGQPQRRFTEYGIKLIYRYTATNNHPMRLKLEINTTEYFNALDLQYKEFSVDGSNWFSGSALITSYQLDELMATKLRALYQLRKGRDLFDVALIFGKDLVDIEKTIALFQIYCEQGNTPISGKIFIENMEQKRLHSGFREEMTRLLPEGVTWNFDEAFEFVLKEILPQIP